MDEEKLNPGAKIVWFNLNKEENPVIQDAKKLKTKHKKLGQVMENIPGVKISGILVGRGKKIPVDKQNPPNCKYHDKTHQNLHKYKHTGSDKGPGVDPKHTSKLLNILESIQARKKQKEAEKQTEYPVLVKPTWETYHSLEETTYPVPEKRTRKPNLPHMGGIILQINIFYRILLCNVIYINIHSRSLRSIKYAFDTYLFKSFCKIEVFTGCSKFFLFQKPEHEIDRYCHNKQGEPRTRSRFWKSYSINKDWKPSTSQTNISGELEIRLLGKNQYKHQTRKKTLFFFSRGKTRGLSSAK